MRFLKATLLLFLSVTISVAASAEEGGILGVWIVKEETRRGEQEYTLTLSDDGGTWEGGRGSSEISDLTIGENVLSFSRAMSRGGEETVLKYTSKLVDGMLVGTIASAQGEREFTASRIPESVLQAREDRKVAIAALETCDILGVFAHPDDETFAIGTFAKLSANGKRIQLVYATSGDAGGDQTGQGLTGDALAKYREGEMNAAADVMNVSASPLYLRYPDGFVRDHWDDVLGDVQSIMEKTAPKIIVSFGPDGYYGHSDHLAIGQIAERAFDELGSASHLLHVARKSVV